MIYTLIVQLTATDKKTPVLYLWYAITYILTKFVGTVVNKI